MDNSDQEQIKHLARLRLGRILLAEKKFDEALQLVESVKPGNYQASYEELKGDIYVAKGQTEQAQIAYNTALQSLEPGSRLRQYIEMKIDDLGKTKSTEES
jgi:predicted negative regulator of RcsB-dependent stress response